LDDRVVVAGAALAAFPQAKACGEPLTLGLSLPHPTAREIKRIRGAVGDRQPDGEFIEGVWRGALVLERKVDEEDALVCEGEGLFEAKLERRIDENNSAFAVTALDLLDGKEGREAGVGSMTADRGTARKPARRLAEHAGIGGLVEVTVRDTAVGDRPKNGWRDVSERSSPVQDDGVP
jgi:hypothetical protein